MELIYNQLFKLLAAVLLSSFIGLERELKHKPAGVKTHVLVCVGATLVTLLAVNPIVGEVPRIMAAIITGMGFIGAGAIIAHGSEHVRGLTTAASLWIVASLGIAIGLGFYILGVITAIIILVTLYFGEIIEKRLAKRYP
ncbi:MAG: MgtC/SapB family protein [Nanoarchaeota archaeon]